VDYYDTLTAGQQAAFRTQLFETLDADVCPQVAGLTGLANADAFTDDATRTAAVNCYQQAHGMPSGGTLDAPTYRAIMGVSSLGEKLVIAAVLALVVASFMKGKR
jgi:hypothetical protein